MQPQRVLYGTGCGQPSGGRVAFDGDAGAGDA